MSWVGHINYAVEQAIVAYLRSFTLSGVNYQQIYPGMGKGDTDLYESVQYSDEPGQTLPCVKVIADNWDCPLEPDQGVYRVNARIEVWSNADDTATADHNTRAGEIFDAFTQTGVNAGISAQATDFTLQFMRRMSGGYRIEDRAWVSFLNLEMIVNPND
jgi:hypothetical protein